MKGLLVSTALAVALLSVGVSRPAQSGQSDKAITRYDERGNMISVVRLATDETRLCSKFVYVGTITRAQYDNQRELQEFSIRRRGKQVVTVNLSEATLEDVDSKKVPTLIRKGVHVRVVAYGCGASGSFQVADEIKKLD